MVKVEKKETIPKVMKAVKTEKTEAPKKRTAKKKVSIDATAYIEFSGNKINVSDVMEKVRAHYAENFEKKCGVLKSVALYIKPECGVVYYVANGVGSDDYKVEF